MKNRFCTYRIQFGFIPLLVMAGFFATILMYWITAQGPGISLDSITYIEAARTVSAGNGLFVDGKPMTHYPPAYPLLLAALRSFTGNDILLAARLLSSLLFGINFVLVAIAVYMCTRHDILATGLVIPVVLLSAPVLSIHSMAWSEAPYIAFSMTGFILLSQHVARPNLKFLVLASLAAGFAAATRYIGIAILPASVLALFVFGHRSLKQKISDIVLFSAIACLPLVSWFIRNMLVAQSATNRQIVFHPFSSDHIKNLIGTMYNFVLPIPISGWTKAFHVGVVVILLVLAIRALHQKTDIKQSQSSIRVVLPSVLVIYSVVYISFLLLSISFFDAHTPINDRLLLPVFFALIVAFISIAKVVSEAFPQKWAWYGFVLFCAFSVSIHAVPAVSRALDIHREGTGYTARHWRQSGTLAVLAHVPEPIKIYSNGPDVIRFHIRKRAYMIPAKVYPGTLQQNKNLQGQMSQMIEECGKGNALIVYFDRITWRWYLPSKEDIESQLNIPLASALDDGMIYGLSVMQKKAEQGVARDGDSAALHPRQ